MRQLNTTSNDKECRLRDFHVIVDADDGTSLMLGKRVKGSLGIWEMYQECSRKVTNQKALREGIHYYKRTAPSLPLDTNPEREFAERPLPTKLLCSVRKDVFFFWNTMTTRNFPQFAQNQAT